MPWTAARKRAPPPSGRTTKRPSFPPRDPLNAMKRPWVTTADHSPCRRRPPPAGPCRPRGRGRRPASPAGRGGRSAPRCRPPAPRPEPWPRRPQCACAGGRRFADRAPRRAWQDRWRTGTRPASDGDEHMESLPGKRAGDLSLLGHPYCVDPTPLYSSSIRPATGRVLSRGTRRGSRGRHGRGPGGRTRRGLPAIPRERLPPSRRIEQSEAPGKGPRALVLREAHDAVSVLVEEPERLDVARPFRPA